MRKLHPNEIKYRKTRLRSLDKLLNTGATEMDINDVIKMTGQFYWSEFDGMISTCVSQTYDDGLNRWMTPREIAAVEYDFIFPDAKFIEMYISKLMNYAEYVAKNKIDIDKIADEAVKTTAKSLHKQSMRVDSPAMRARMMAGLRAYAAASTPKASNQYEDPFKV